MTAGTFFSTFGSCFAKMGAGVELSEFVETPWQCYCKCILWGGSSNVDAAVDHFKKIHPDAIILAFEQGGKPFYIVKPAPLVQNLLAQLKKSHHVALFRSNNPDEVAIRIAPENHTKEMVVKAVISAVTEFFAGANIHAKYEVAPYHDFVITPKQ